ncbi:MAG TPA: hypothetical protein VNZ52_00380 [Candidatus Thermoplasmatota archaeon]|nr:hypothetical protein [Candidatus Thermoplasmatota archaeon]
MSSRRRAQAILSVVAVALLTLPALLMAPSAALPNGQPSWGPWRTERVEANGRGLTHTGLAFGPGDVPHIIYPGTSPADFGAAWYAYRSGLNWERVYLEQYGSPGDIAVDAAGRAHMVYRGDPGIRYATYHQGVLAKETVDPGVAAQDMAITLDASGVPHVAYVASSTTVKHGYRDPATGTWALQTILKLPAGGSNAEIAFALDSAGRPHIAYDVRSNTNPGTWYVTRTATGIWVSEELGPDCEYSAGLALDSQDRPHIVCSHEQRGLYYVTRPTSLGAWAYERVDAGFRHGTEPDIVLDRQDRPHIAYAHGYNPGWPDDPTRPGQLHYATRTAAGTWAIELVDPVGQYNGIGPSIALDSWGLPHISYILGWHRFSEGALDPVLERRDILYAEPVVATGLGLMP